MMGLSSSIAYKVSEEILISNYSENDQEPGLSSKDKILPISKNGLYFLQ